MTVDSPRGFPRRVTLAEAQPGDNVLLLNHASRTDADLIARRMDLRQRKR